MSDKLRCPECLSTIKKWDHTRYTYLKINSLNNTVGQMGLWGFVISLVSSWFVYKTDELESGVWKCHDCNKNFTGEKLKPFEWSDYE